jgi:hypothetical protein
VSNLRQVAPRGRLENETKLFWSAKGKTTEVCGLPLVRQKEMCFCFSFSRRLRGATCRSDWQEGMLQNDAKFLASMYKNGLEVWHEGENMFVEHGLEHAKVKT